MSNPQCLTVHLREFPDTIEWRFADGTVETTSDDLTSRAGRMNIASRASKLGFGAIEEIARHLNGFKSGCESGVALLQRWPIPVSP